MKSFWKSRPRMVGLLAVLALALGAYQASAGGKINFTDPAVAVQRTEERVEKPTTRRLNLESPAKELNAPANFLPPEEAPSKKKDKKEKANDWWNPSDSADTTDPATPTTPSRITRAWNNENRPDADPLRGDSDDLDDKRNGSSKKENDRRGSDAQRLASPLFGDSPFRNIRDSAKDRLEELKRQNDRQARMEEFNALYNMPTATTPIGSASSGNPIHDSMWKPPGERLGFGDPSSRGNRDLLPQGPAAPMASRVQVWDNQAAASPNGTQFRPRNAAQQADQDRYSAPVMLEIPRPPGSVFK